MSSESLSNDYIASLISGQKYLYRFGGLVLIILGSLSCILTMIVFSKKKLRKNPCSIYLMAYDIANFLYIYSSILSLTLLNGYEIQLGLYNLVICRLTYYMAFVFDCLSPFYLILASIDRILITSPNALTRRRCICIISGTLFWMLFQSHTLVFTDIFQLAPGYSLCYFQPGLYTVLMGCYSLLIKGILVPVLLVLFGVWTSKNIQNLRVIRIVHVLPRNRNIGNNDLHLIHSKDRQLILMLLTDIIIYIFFTSMLSVVAVYQQITHGTRQSIEQTQTDLFVRNMAVFSTYVPFCIDCCRYILVSKTFRSELKTILLSCKRVICFQP